LPDLTDHETPPPGSPASSGSEIADALADVLEHTAKRAEAEASAEKPRDRSSAFHWFGLGILTAISAYLWFGAPDWIQPEPPPPPTVQLEEAGLRLNLYLQAMRIERFRTAEGRLPASLVEAGDPISNIEYQRMDEGTYHLSGTSDNMVLGFTSTEPLETLLTDAMAVIRGGTS
jgi:hypothetical protein